VTQTCGAMSGSFANHIENFAQREKGKRFKPQRSIAIASSLHDIFPVNLISN
jgi:hypothetical protein